MKVAPADTKFAMSIITAVKKGVKGADVKLGSEGEFLSDVQEWIPTGFAGLDEILGGGWAVGRASETSGPEGSGKSALAQMACVQTQRLGGFVVYLDFEHAVDMKKMIGLGLDPAGLLYVSPDHIEQGWDVVWSVIDRLLDQNPPGPTLFVWDSVGGALTKAQLEASAEESTVGSVARVMTPNCAKLFKKIQRCRAHMLFVNQERATIGGFSRFGPPPKHTPGGGALKYAASLRVRCQRVSILKAGGNTGPAIGYLIKTTTDKNKLVPPHQKVTWVLDFKVGPSPSLTMFESLKDRGKIVSAQGVCTLRGVKGKSFTRATWSARLAEPEFAAAATALYMQGIRDGSGPLDHPGSSTVED